MISSRTVSKSWNDAVLAMFFKRPAKGQPGGHLDLNKLFESSQEDPLKFPDFEPKLASSIYFDESFVSDQNSPTDSSTNKAKFVAFCQQLSAQIRVMELE